MAWKRQRVHLERSVLAAQCCQRVLGTRNMPTVTVGALVNMPELWHLLNGGSTELAGLAVRTSHLLPAHVGMVAICPGTRYGHQPDCSCQAREKSGTNGRIFLSAQTEQAALYGEKQLCDNHGHVTLCPRDCRRRAAARHTHGEHRPTALHSHP